MIFDDGNPSAIPARPSVIPARPLVIPAQAGIQAFGLLSLPWVPAFAGMTAKFSMTLLILCMSFQAVGVFADDHIAAPLDFNRDIRPILSENCFYCHGQDKNKRESGVRLDQREEAIEAGAFVPGNVLESAILQRVHATDESILMPPPKSNRKLTEAQKQTLERWISEGANYSKHWAFENPVKTKPLNSIQSEWIQNPIDAFVLQKLDASGLKPSPRADRATLIKRLYCDLIGLPPSQEAVARFTADDDPLAYEKLVDQLLNHPAYGERLALSWLDTARYADSNGFQQDGDTWQWYWRDWVVRALNSNMSFDQFTICQLAGDLLPNATTDQKIASGFNRNHLLNGEGGAIAEEQRFVILFDRIDTTSTTWLGLTMACAQCHDHKYDPITQRDYYSFMDVFNHLPESGVPQYFSSRVRVAPPLMELPTEENKTKIAALESQIEASRREMQPWADSVYAGWRAGLLSDGKIEGKGLPENLISLFKKPEAERNEDDKKALEGGLRKHFDDKVQNGLKDNIPGFAKSQSLQNELNAYRSDQIPRVMIMSDSQSRDTSILDRGDYLKPLEKVTFTTPHFLPPLQENFPKNRLGLAEWLVSSDHPLTARVQVNRMWQHFFGAGLVKTSEDFGVQSEYPVHLALLDWLAVQFRDSGWNVKAMHRIILTSSTYQQSSRLTPELRNLDPENRLYARASRFRLPSIVLRDWALSVSNLIDRKIGGQPVYPYQPDGIWESLAITKERDFTYPSSQGSELYRRSLYTFWRRTVGPANMFDASNRQSCRVRMTQTSTPLHALTTLNDPTWVEAARVLAERSIRASALIDERLDFAFREVACRHPSAKELATLKKSFEKQWAMYQSNTDAARSLLAVGNATRDSAIDLATHAAMTNVCLAILNLDEAVCRE